MRGQQDWQQYEFDRIHGGWWETMVERDAKEAVRRSADRYIRWVNGR